MEHATLPKIVFIALTTGALVASQSALAHTKLQTPTAVEGTRVYNNAAIGHGCGENPVIANSIVFPDGTDSIVKINGAPVSGAIVDDYISWGGLISHIPSKDVFAKSDVKWGRAGLAGNNAVGNHSGYGSIPAHGYVGLVPFRVNAAVINAESCAQSVTFNVAIADICKVTSVSNFTAETVNLWTPAVGSKFDGVGLDGYNSPATYKITRDLVKNPLPSTCNGVGVDVVVDPSADQLNADLPIPGAWPLAN